MPGKIPKIFIIEILEKTNLVNLINSRIKLKKNGQNYHSICPFHNEKTPSFVVNQTKQFFYCFGCKIHGNAIDFIMMYDKVNFLDSIETLALLNGLTIPYTEQNSQTVKKIFKKKTIHSILKQVSYIYQKILLKDQENIAYKYLQLRGIKLKTIKKFSIGFSGKNNKLITNTLEKKKINTEILENTGLVIQNNLKQKYDRFRYRIMFPIRDKYGRINGFGGRTLFKKKENPKYINSPETITFHKKKNLYGIYEIYQSIKKIKKILIVEGYFDVLSLSENKIHCVVGLLGTQLTIKNLEQLFKICNYLIFCYDGDSAGELANWQSLKMVLPFLQDDKIVKFIFLPKNEDPSSLINREGKEKFKKRIKEATSIYTFFFNYITKNLDLSKIEDQIKLSYISLPLVNSISGTTTKIHFRKILGEKIGILNTHELEKILYIKKYEKNIRNNTFKITIMHILISILLQNPKLSKISINIKKINKFKIPGIKTFIYLMFFFKKYSDITTGQILEYFRGTKLDKIVTFLINWDNMIIPKNIKNTFLYLLKKLKIKNLENQYNQLISKERKIGLNLKEKKKIWEINKKLAKYNMISHHI